MKGPGKVTTPRQYIDRLAGPRRGEIVRIDEFIRACVPELRPCMCAGMLAYGPYHYKYASGREGDWARVMLAGHSRYIALHVCAADDSGYLARCHAGRLGKVSVHGSCIRFERFDDVDHAVLGQVLRLAEQADFSI